MNQYGFFEEKEAKWPACLPLIASALLEAIPQNPNEEIVSVLVEVPFGTPNKYELEKAQGRLGLQFSSFPS